MTTKTKSAKAGKLYWDGNLLHLDGQIGAGREGTVHALTDVPGLAAKLIGPHNPGPEDTARKLALMTANPPAVTHSRHYRITWPTALITDRKRKGLTIGYIMPRLDGKTYRHIGSYFNPARRRHMLTGRKYGYTYLHLLRLARNLALAVDRIHSHGALLGDLNSRNVMAGDHGRVAIIDTDSFQIPDPSTGGTRRCLVGTPEYTSPKLQGREFSCIDRTQDDDLFALAVMIYQLLIQGSHPFAGTINHAGDTKLQHIASRIAKGAFAHQLGKNSPISPTANAALIWEDLPLKRQFRAAFQETRPRTTARAWAQAIEKAAASTKHCWRRHLHWHFRRYCTWCRYETKTGVEAFPSPTQANRAKPAAGRPPKRRG